MSRSTRRLSEVARRLVIPTGIETTGWPAVEFWLRKLGLPFDGWQRGIAQLALGKRANGVYACTVGGVYLSIPRQVGKTYMIGGLVFALCMLHPGLTVIWTAHRTKTAAETYKSMKGMTRRRAISPYVDKTPKNNDEWGVFFTNGSRILFGARENGFGRGFAQVDVLVFDEAQILGDKALDDMIPAMNASRQKTGGLAFYTGTPPRPGDDSEVFTRARDEALSGESDDALWVEFAPKAAVDPTTWPTGFIDWEAFAEANPSFPDRTPESSVLRMMRQLSRESLRREGLGVWDAAGAKRAISKGAWSQLVTHDPPTSGRDVLGVRFSRNGDRVAAAIARHPEEGPTHVEVVGAWPLADGTRLLASWIVEARGQLAGVVVDGRAAQAAFVAELRRLKVPARLIIEPTVPQVSEAHAQALDLIESDRMTHADQPGLNAAIAAATKRKIGTLGAWGWEAIGAGDVLALDAATFALWGAETRKTRAPAVPQRLN